MTETDYELLREVRKKLSNDGWCKNNYAQLLDGAATFAEDQNACRFCLSGAIQSVAPHSVSSGHLHRALSRKLNQTGWEDGLIAFNDHQETVEPVLALIDSVLTDDPHAH